MKRNARKVFNILKSAGVPVRDTNLWSNGHFELIAEGDMPLEFTKDGKWYYADYYEMFWGTDDLFHLLDDNGLYFEWQNAAIMGVYDA